MPDERGRGVGMIRRGKKMRQLKESASLLLVNTSIFDSFENPTMPVPTPDQLKRKTPTDPISPPPIRRPN